MWRRLPSLALKLRAIKKDPHVSFGCETLRLDRACRYTTTRERFGPLDSPTPTHARSRVLCKPATEVVHYACMEPETPRHFFSRLVRSPLALAVVVWFGCSSLGFKSTKLVPSTLLNGSTLGLARNRWVSIAYNTGFRYSTKEPLYILLGLSPLPFLFFTQQTLISFSLLLFTAFFWKKQSLFKCFLQNQSLLSTSLLLTSIVNFFQVNA
jgi:hypothetical protein